MNPLRRLIRWQWEVRHTVLADAILVGVLYVSLVAWVTVALVFLPGCATTPQPVPCEPMSVRLLQHRGYVTCMTGPWGHERMWLSAARWVKEKQALNPLNALNLPRGCEVFDVDHDGDVDLEDWIGVQNGIGR